jgi:hypothetical protein
VSETVSRDPASSREPEFTQPVGQPTGAPAGVEGAEGAEVEPLHAHRSRRNRRGRVAVAAVIVVLLAGGAAAAWRAGAFRSHGSPGSGASSSAGATATVTRRDLSSQTTVNATLGYAGSYTVAGNGSGTLTWLPLPGQVIRQGQVLYRVDNGTPIVLLYGTVPMWRTLSEGLTGADVSQLNHDLVALGYISGSDVSALGWDYFSWETRYGVERLQSALGIANPPGSLTLGAAVFEPSAIRVSNVQGSLGSRAGGSVFAATSAQHAVTISLDASQQSEVKAGDAVTVTLPDGSNTPGVISSIGKVASGSGSSATIPVYVTLTHPGAAGTLDQAPVTVNITAASARNVLTVPVSALLAQASGGYAVEVVSPGSARHLVPVTTGIFDDAAGLVEVNGTGLAAGQHVVVPSA